MTRNAVIAVLLVAAIAAGTVATLVGADVGGTVFFVSYAGTGAFLVLRRPQNLIGWLLVVIGSCLAMGTVRVTTAPEALAAGALEPAAAAAAWANGCGWALVLVAIAALTLVFPSGQLPVGAGARPARFLLATSVAISILITVSPMISVTPANTGHAIDVPNPAALAPDAMFWAFVPPPDVLFGLASLPFVAGILWLVVRYRRSRGLERLQYRWLVAALTAVAVTSAAWVIGTEVLVQNAWVWNVPVAFAYPTVPLAIAVAVLRHRLYDIDRIVSRSIGWALVTGCLVTTFAVGVVALQALLAGVTQGETLAVAASTLVVFALFQPVRRRVQSAVDRRFDRAGYDAQRTVDAFAEAIRHDVDLGALRAALLATTDDTVRPVNAALWLRREPT